MLQIRQECPLCGKRCYLSRKAAKKAARLLHPGTHMRRYKCGDYWHVTSMREHPAWLSRDAPPARFRGGIQEAA